MDKETRYIKPSNNVLQELLSSLGSESPLQQEVLNLVHEKGFDPNRLTISELREIVAAYARKVFKLVN